MSTLQHNALRNRPHEVVLTTREAGEILARLKSAHWLITCLQYGSGLRLLGSVRVRIKDLDFIHRAILVRNGKGGEDGVATLPDDLIVPLHCHLENRKTLFEQKAGRAG